MINFQKKWLQPLKAEGRLRRLSPPCGRDFSSNDYLGMANHPLLRQSAQNALANGMAIGAGASRLLRGQHPAHAALEDYAAMHFACDKTLFFANGFMANYALLSTLPERHDSVLVDELAHASMRDGLQAGFAQKIKIPHNNLQAYEDALKRVAGKGQIWIAVESLYSMDGDFAPLSELYQLACHYDAILLIDEAHSTGIYGEKGRGCAAMLGHASPHLIVVHTCGKALGVAGALVCASADIIDTLINRARPFIYSTAPMPLQAHLVQESLCLLESEPHRREKIKTLIQAAQKILPEYDWQSQILPIILGSDKLAVKCAAALQDAGFDIRAIRPPTVPEGTARLRISLNLSLQEQDIADCAAVLRPLLQAKAA